MLQFLKNIFKKKQQPSSPSFRGRVAVTSARNFEKRPGSDYRSNSYDWSGDDTGILAAFPSYADSSPSDTGTSEVSSFDGFGGGDFGGSGASGSWDSDSSGGFDGGSSSDFGSSSCD